MEDYEIIGCPNDNMGIGSSTYLINKEWYDSIGL